MLSTANDGIAGNATWSAECSDALEWLRSLPTRSVSMVLFSPPYEGQRTYGLNFKRKGQVWSDWLRPIIVESARVSSGLVIVNAACPVRKWSYSPALEWLVADLTRIDGLVCGPSPYAWVKSADDPEALGNGVCGSGSKHYQRRDWEPLYAFCLPDRLPLAWSDNTAFGRPPGYPAGGETTHRMKNGKRRGDGVKRRTKRVPSGGMNSQTYRPPELSNPGNVIRAPAHRQGAAVSLFTEVIAYGHASETSPAEVLRSLRQAIGSGSIYEWGIGICSRLHAAAVLRPEVHGSWRTHALTAALRFLQDRVPPEELREEVLFAEMQVRSPSEERSRDGCGERIADQGSPDQVAQGMQPVRSDPATGDSPHGRESAEQHPTEPRGPLRDLPRETSQPAASMSSDVQRLWLTRSEELQGIWGALRQALSPLQEAWLTAARLSRRAGQKQGNETASNVIRAPVGGAGRLGHPLAHESEAPMSLGIAERFVRWFVPVGGIVADPFGGSGTTLQAALEHSRKGIMCDIRESQVELTRRRLATVTIPLFT